MPFPVEAEVTVKFRPPEPFGAAKGPSHAWIRTGGEAKVHIALFTGRMHVISSAPLEPVRSASEVDWLKLEFEGNVAKAYFRCDSNDDLHGTLNLLAFGLPPLLSIHLGEPVVASDVGGKLGSDKFVWGLVVATPQLIVSDQEHQESQLRAALDDLPWLADYENPRLIVALNYFQSAVRLLHAGVSIYEFLGEAVLNYAKMLQAFFGESREAVREGLMDFGISSERIERTFIPMLILRSQFDSAHVMLAGMTVRERTVLSRYVQDAQYSFVELVRDILSALRSGEKQLPPYVPEPLDDERRSVLERIDAASPRWKKKDDDGSAV